MTAARVISFLVRVLLLPLFLIVAPLIAVASRPSRRRDPKRMRLFWGTFPILNYKYWSGAMSAAGWDSETVTGPPLAINNATDFDRYMYERPTGGAFSAIAALPRWLLGRHLEFLRALWRYDIFHHTYDGGFLGETRIWRIEAYLYKLAGIKAVVLPVGGDAFMYSKVTDLSLRHGLLSLGYDDPIHRESKISSRIEYWRRHSDVAICGLIHDGMGRWDALPVSPLAVNTDEWKPRRANRAVFDDRPVVVLHSPNHRVFKGTEFLVKAVDDLLDEGLNVELKLLQKVPNSEVLRAMQEEADILVEQVIFTGYALSGLEGMACGLPVMSNLESAQRTQVFRRYSYLDECPVLSTTPETLKDNLRLLVTDAELRKRLGDAGRAYAEKYHSFNAAVFMFGYIYRYLAGENLDLLNLYHPLLGRTDELGPRLHPPLGRVN